MYIINVLKSTVLVLVTVFNIQASCIFAMHMTPRVKNIIIMYSQNLEEKLKILTKVNL